MSLILSFPHIDSTSDEAKRRICAGDAVHGQVILATTQSAGHGRQGRVWESPPGNLYASLIWQLEPYMMEMAPQLSFVMALAVGKALDVEDYHYKWPNDILVKGKKISGILLEAMHTGGGQGYVVIGVGINIVAAPDYATCLHACGGTMETPRALLDRLLAHFDEYEKCWKMKGFSPIREEWLARAYRLGQEIEVRLPNHHYTGIFCTLSEEGALELDCGEARVSLAAGEIL